MKTDNRRTYMTYQEYELIEKKRIENNIRLMENGVNFIDIRSAYIDESVEIGAGTTVYPGVVIEGNTVIGENNIIGQNSHIKDSRIGDDNTIESSYILKSVVGNGNTVGPFAYMRPDSTIGNGCRVGDFVEIKNSSLADGAKASHLTYIGDSDVGSKVNLGCGVVFVNYDGSKKERSVVGDGAFIGCNVNLVAPVSVGEGAYVAAGSTVTSDGPGGALFVARDRGTVKEDWVAKKGILKKK